MKGMILFVEPIVTNKNKIRFTMTRTKLRKKRLNVAAILGTILNNIFMSARRLAGLCL